MPPLFEEITQEIELPGLDLMEGERSPAFLGRYQTSNVLTNTLAHVVARVGTHSELVNAATPVGADISMIGLVVCDYYVRVLHSILSDVWDPIGHALNVDQIT